MKGAWLSVSLGVLICEHKEGSFGTEKKKQKKKSKVGLMLEASPVRLIGSLHGKPTELRPEIWQRGRGRGFDLDFQKKKLNSAKLTLRQGRQGVNL